MIRECFFSWKCVNHKSPHMTHHFHRKFHKLCKGTPPIVLGFITLPPIIISITLSLIPQNLCFVMPNKTVGWNKPFLACKNLTFTIDAQIYNKEEYSTAFAFMDWLGGGSKHPGDLGGGLSGALLHLVAQIVKIVQETWLDRELYHSLILSWYLP